MVRVRAPTSRIRPSGSCRIITRLASQARCWDVFCGNVRAVVEDRLTGRIRVRQHRRVDVNHDLVTLARGAGIDSVVERRFGDEGQRVRLLLRQGGRLRRHVGAGRSRGNGLACAF